MKLPPPLHEHKQLKSWGDISKSALLVRLENCERGGPNQQTMQS